MKYVLILVVFCWGGICSAEEDTFKVGVILPLTGEGAWWGENARLGITMAAQDINEGGGINGRKVSLLIDDGQCSGTASVTAIKRLIEIEKVPVVLGEICDSATQAIAPLAQRAGVVLITPGSEAPSITENRDYVFRMWVPNDRQGRFMASFAWNDLKVKRAAVLAIENDYGIPLADAFSKEFRRLGGDVSFSATYRMGTSDFKTQLLRIRSTKPEVLYLAAQQVDGIAIINQVKQLGMGVHILGVSAMNSKEAVFDPLGSRAEGLILADLEDHTSADFRERYRSVSGKEWPGVSGTVASAYDSLAVVALAARNVGVEPSKIRDYLANLKDYQGVSGPLSFDEHRSLTTSHGVFVVRGGILVEYGRGIAEDSVEIKEIP